MKLSAEVGGSAGLTALKERLLDELKSEALYSSMGGAVSSAIVSRTLSGVDVEGEPFRDYSEKYEMQRAKKGKGSRPDLSMTGSMLDDIVVQASGPEMTARVTFNSPEGTDRAFYNDTGLKGRHFLGAGETEAENLKSEVLKAIDSAL